MCGALKLYQIETKLRNNSTFERYFHSQNLSIP